MCRHGHLSVQKRRGTYRGSEDSGLNQVETELTLRTIERGHDDGVGTRLLEGSKIRHWTGTGDLRDRWNTSGKTHRPSSYQGIRWIQSHHWTVGWRGSSSHGPEEALFSLKKIILLPRLSIATNETVSCSDCSWFSATPAPASASDRNYLECSLCLSSLSFWNNYLMSSSNFQFRSYDVM